MLVWCGDPFLFEENLCPLSCLLLLASFYRRRNGLLLISAGRDLARILTRLDRRLEIIMINGDLRSDLYALDEIATLRSAETCRCALNARLRRRNDVD